MNEEQRESLTAALCCMLADWDRYAWMQAHGEWASAEWDDARDAPTAALDAARDELDRIDPERVDTCARHSVASAMDAVCAAIRALDGQVIANDSDYIAEGVIDPDGVSDDPDTIDLKIGESWQGWDCREGWGAWRNGSSLYVHWYRDAYGSRHDRDLWVLVGDEFFEGE